MLVVTKASLKENWRRELEKWLVRPMPVGIAEAQRWPKESVVVCNYDVLMNHHNALRERPWDLVVLDEIQYIKNRKTKRAIAVIGFTPTKKAQAAGEKIITPIPGIKRLALSGTPIENRPEELWTTLNYLDPQRWGSFYSYAQTYCDAHRTNFGFNTKGAANLDKLQELLRSTIMIRRLKKDVMKELPAKTRMIIYLDTKGLESFIKAEQRTFSSCEDDLAEAQAAMELAKTDEDAARYHTAIVELSNAKWKFNELAKVRHDTAVAKTPQMIDLLQEELESCSKVLFFAHHHDVLKPMHAAFPGSVLITGETKDRQSLCDKFQTDPKCRILFGSIHACGEGLNLTAANLVVIGEEDWEPAKINQVEDRAHRIGQKDNVFVKHYIVPGTVDARMIKVNIAKQVMIDQALNDPTDAAPVFVPHEPLGRRNVILDEGLMMLSREVFAVHAGLRRLWPNGDCPDKVDFGIGRKLAMKAFLTPGEAALGKRLCGRYRSSLEGDLLKAMGWRVPMQTIPMDEDEDDVPM